MSRDDRKKSDPRHRPSVGNIISEAAHVASDDSLSDQSPFSPKEKLRIWAEMVEAAQEAALKEIKDRSN